MVKQNVDNLFIFSSQQVFPGTTVDPSNNGFCGPLTGTSGMEGSTFCMHNCPAQAQKPSTDGVGEAIF